MSGEAFGPRIQAVFDVAKERTPNDEPAHDFLHVRRVVKMACAIAKKENANIDIVAAAALLHELFNYPKSSPQSRLSGDVCAQEAELVLKELGWGSDDMNNVGYAIRVHSFSRGVIPETIEAKVLQDADRLDAIGAIGIARCFATCAAMKRPFYSSEDPFCQARTPDDKEFGLDHFYRKLLTIPDRLHTDSAKQIGAKRAAFLRTYLSQLTEEI